MGNGIDAGNPSISCSKRRRVSVCAASGMSSMEEDVCAIDADNFYDILGVSPAASTRQIKTAYKLMMKDFHPDLSGDEESTEFCILLNEIYEVTATATTLHTMYIAHRIHKDVLFG
jgi:DnaJ-domain-containing protein 1